MYTVSGSLSYTTLYQSENPGTCDITLPLHGLTTPSMSKLCMMHLPARKERVVLEVAILVSDCLAGSGAVVVSRRYLFPCSKFYTRNFQRVVVVALFF